MATYDLFSPLIVCLSNYCMMLGCLTWELILVVKLRMEEPRFNNAQLSRRTRTALQMAADKTSVTCELS